MEEITGAQIAETAKKPARKVTRKRVKKKKPASQKRYMKPRKCYLSDEEMADLRSRMPGVVSESNCLRIHLGFNPNTPGRKKKNPPSAIKLDFLNE